MNNKLIKPSSLTQKQENFAQAIFQGLSQRQAYINAGYSYQNMLPATIDRNAHELYKSNKISTRIAELNQAALTPKIMNNREIQERLSELSRANLLDFLDEYGQPQLTRDTPNSAAAKEYHVTERYDRDGNLITSRNIKLTDPVSAIQELNKMQGNYAPTKHLHANVTFEVNLVEKPARDEEIPTEDEI